MSASLFSSYKLGPTTLANRVVMAPMTRSRSPGNLPGDLVVKYYTQRATAGLIITEGTSSSPNGLGYARIPGLFNDQQVSAWKKVTDSVHKAGGKIFVQLMHCGRVCHPLNMPPGSKIVGPSALALEGTMWTDSEQMQPHPTPTPMSETDIATAIGEYVASAECAIKAGFDGVELHGANGYLIDQFLNPASNIRTDSWGGTPEKRLKFALEVCRQTAAKIGKDRIGIRLSPFGAFNGMGTFAEMEATFESLAAQISSIGLVYLHVVDHSPMGAPPIPATMKPRMRKAFKGTFILSGGYDRPRAEADLAEGKGDLVAFGRPFISNPNLVEKMTKNLTLAAPDQSTFYTPGEKGYTDYP
jgi:N-ethylmaleimide reductase